MVANTYGGSPLIRRNSMPARLPPDQAPARHLRPAADGAPGPRPVPAAPSTGSRPHPSARTTAAASATTSRELGPGADRPGGAGRRPPRPGVPAAAATVSPTGPPQVTSTPSARQLGHPDGSAVPEVDGDPEVRASATVFGPAPADPHRDARSAHGRATGPAGPGARQRARRGCRRPRSPRGSAGHRCRCRRSAGRR